MRKITKYSRKMKMIYAAGAFASCFGMLLANPIMSDRGDRDGSFYNIVINGQAEGTVLKESTANEIITEARKQIASESQDLIFMDYDFEIVSENQIFGTIDNIDSVKEKVYNELKKSIVETKQKAYTVKIDDFSITLASKNEVIQLLDAAKSKYDENNEFSIDLVSEEDQEMPAMEPNIYKMEKSENPADTVGET